MSEQAQKILDYLRAMNTQEGSDLYLTVGYPPCLRVESRMEPLRPQPMDADEINEIMSVILTPRQRRDFENHMEMNASLDMGTHGRYRINALRQRQNPALVIRRITSKIPNFEELRLPPIMERLSLMKRGLILLTGMTGSGKSTTLASMIDYRNSRESGHIVTIEDPVEFFHDHKKSLVSQREIGTDTESYQIALKNVLRQRPDVILIGEIRDREVMEQALTIAETGHLCLATLHTTNTYQAIERVVNFFPEDAQGQVRLNLALNLRAIICQRLIPSVSGDLTLAVELMLNEGLIKDLILEGKITKVPEIMAQNSAATGMCTFDQSLLDLYRQGMITEETAYAHADTPGDVRMKIKQIKIAQGNGGESLKTLDTSGLKISDADE